jgi:toxin ParE1/3/4
VSQSQISKAACQDLDAIAEYFLTRNIDTGERFFQEFNQKCKNLIKFPLMGRSYVSIDVDLRGLPIQSYIILYRITKDTQLEIVRVVNGRQDLEDLFSEA